MDGGDWMSRRLARLHAEQHAVQQALGIECGALWMRPLPSVSDPPALADADSGSAPRIAIERRIEGGESNDYSDILVCRVENGAAGWSNDGSLKDAASTAWPPSQQQPQYTVVLKNIALDRRTPRCTAETCASRRALRKAEWVERLALEWCTQLVEERRTPSLPVLYGWYNVGVPRLSRAFTTTNGAGSAPHRRSVVGAQRWGAAGRAAYGGTGNQRGGGGTTLTGISKMSGSRPSHLRRVRSAATTSLGALTLRASRRTRASGWDATAARAALVGVSTIHARSPPRGGVALLSSSAASVAPVLAARSLLFATEFARGGNLQALLERGEHRTWSATDWHALLFHLFGGLYAMQKHRDMTHHDMHFGNVLLVPLDDLEENGGPYVWHYRIDGRAYTVPARRGQYLPLVWDWGVAFRPDGVVTNTDFSHTHEQDEEDSSRHSTDYLNVLLLLDEYDALPRGGASRPYRHLMRWSRTESVPMPLGDAIAFLFADLFAPVGSDRPPDTVSLGAFDMD